jgi:5-(carboxyamino)imidazole ribonucleotide synthase
MATEDTARFGPGSVLGILGGGQLGRMIALAAADYGIRSHIFAPEPDSPAFDVAAEKTIADYADEAALARFAACVDVITYEFENVPARTAQVLAALKPLRPGTLALATAQDRLVEKRFLAGIGLEPAPFRAVDDLAGLKMALAEIGGPSVLKTRRFGYDGKGQCRIMPGDDPAAALAEIGNQPAVLEGFVRFSREISVIAARALDGSFAAYDICENTHRNHILDVTAVPANITPATTEMAISASRRIGDALGYVGVFTTEIFVTGTGTDEAIVINEIAPRVHNSGHWTSEGAETSQFHQHVRAVCGLPLGATGRLGAVTMTNLIGDEADGWPDLLAEPGAHLHLYGKLEAKPGRKMGHVTRIRRSAALSGR